MFCNNRYEASLDIFFKDDLNIRIYLIHRDNLSACGAFYTKTGVCYLVDTDPDNSYKNATLLTASDNDYFVRI